MFIVRKFQVLVTNMSARLLCGSGACCSQITHLFDRCLCCRETFGGHFDSHRRRCTVRILDVLKETRLQIFCHRVGLGVGVLEPIRLPHSHQSLLILRLAVDRIWQRTQDLFATSADVGEDHPLFANGFDRTLVLWGTPRIHGVGVFDKVVVAQGTDHFGVVIVETAHAHSVPAVAGSTLRSEIAASSVCVARDAVDGIGSARRNERRLKTILSVAAVQSASGIEPGSWGLC